MVPIRIVMSKRVVVGVSIVIAVLVLCGAAFANNYMYARTTADDAKAAGGLVKGGDFPVQFKLTGGRVKPDETADNESCNGYRPKESDLVVTGDAEARFQDSNRSVVVDSQIEILKTSAMAATDVKRTLPMLTKSCQLQEAKQDHVQLVTFIPMGPARCSCDFSRTMLFEIKTSKATLNHLLLVTGMRKGRAEATVLTEVGKSTADKQNAALQAALTVQGVAVKAVAARLPSR